MSTGKRLWRAPRSALLFQVAGSPFPRASCYLCRDEDRRALRHVNALPERELSDVATEEMLAAMDAGVSGCEEELYSDAELAKRAEFDCLTGFLPDVRRTRLKAALEAGGFAVVELDRGARSIFCEREPMTTPSHVRELTRHLALCSLEDLLTDCKRQYHANAVATAIENSLRRGRRWVVAAIQKERRCWSPLMRNTFLLVTAAVDAHKPFLRGFVVTDLRVAQLVAV